MKPGSIPRRVWGVVAAFLLYACAVGQAQAKPIRLRNGTILPDASDAPAAASRRATNAATSGLFLIQFRAPPGAEARAQLAATGVDLLQYVPEDTFLARLHNVPLSNLRALPRVAWIGEYRPEHKVHSALRAKTAHPEPGPLGVAVLLAPRSNSTEVENLRRRFSVLQQESKLRSGTILRGKLNPVQVDALSRMDCVLWIELARSMKLNDEISSKIVAGDGGPNILLPQLLGFDGTGVKVAVADSGLNNGDAATMHPDLYGRTPDFFYYGSLTDAADEHSHGTHVAGIIAGNGATGETDEYGALYGLGVAPGASIIAQRIFDGAGNYEPPANGFAELTSDATGAGAVIGSNSWGDDNQGQYNLDAQEFDELVRDATGWGTNNRPYILEFSAGNAGPGEQTLDTPAVAKNVIATGACENDRPDFFIYTDGADAMADFSSRGPCEDGRIKPDLVAPGTWIASLQSASATDEYAWLAIDANYQYQGGTSQAGPHASGAAAVFVQYYRGTHTNATPSPALVKAALINTATDMDDSFGTGPVPNMDEGWGRVDLVPLFDSMLTFEFFDQPTPLTNDQVFEHHVLVASAEEPLKITLAYTDVPGFPGVLPALVNDLDLEILGPDGNLYRGNQFAFGDSIPNPLGPDTINNVEAVHLLAPAPGDYLVRVRARNVVSDVFGGSGNPRQDFALVISGLFPAPGTSAVVLDRGSYTAPSRIRITVIDSDQAGHPSVSVLARSTTETNAESLLLSAAGVGGSFTGTIATATGPAIIDGRLQITNNDQIEVTYFDISANADRIASARADLVAPVLQAVYVTNDFGQAVVSWLSDEPGTSIVRYGTNATLTGTTWAVTNTALTTGHAMALDNLVAGQSYFYYVVSADEAGNTATNNNGGALFSFVAAPTAPVLLVDGFTVFPTDLSGYTEALGQLGVQYDSWDIATRGSPTNRLKSYRAVIWRVEELGGAWNSSERYAISNYLHTGGALFVASMQLMTRLTYDAQATNWMHDVLQVQDFVADDQGSTGAAEIIGSPYEPVGNGIDIVMDYTPYLDAWYGVIGPDLSETMTPKANASPVLRNDAGQIVGLRWPAIGQEAPGRLVFFSFPLDAVPIDQASPGVNDRIHLLRNVLTFLVPGFSGLASVTLDSPAYTLPSVVTVEVDDPHKAGGGTVTVTASSTSQTNGLAVTLRETATRGMFLGSFSLIPGPNLVSGKVVASSGDTVRVEYLDASSSSVVLATASVDTVPPVMTTPVADVDYQQAVVYWDTSEAADALVQFGESPLLDRSAHDSEITTSHGVTLPNLKPDQTYYYRVLSRDLAGNTAMDDNDGNLYTFHTLIPLTVPWADHMDTGATNWSVFSGDGVESEWMLGVPNNSLQTAALSPPNAWGCNLSGNFISYSETYLISPAIYLPAGAAATLHFSHCYEFSTQSDLDIVEYGAVLLIKDNDSTSPVTLAEYSEDTLPDWEEEELDLTPYAGSLVYLVWNYELLSFDYTTRPGWLVDDVSITVSNVPIGVIAITNNLWQATYSLTGPTNISRSGPGLAISNAPAGQYSIRFDAVPWYVTPASQTNTLAAGGTIVFQGNYTFPDVNTNDISDFWEQYLFGGVSTNRTAQDYAAFIAGTDPNPPPSFRVIAQFLSNAVCRLSWPSFAAHQYRVHFSTNLTTWQPYSVDWIQTNVVDVPVSTMNKRSFFKVEAQSTLTPPLRLSIQRTASNGLTTASWPASVGRGYCVYGSTNFQDWLPVGNWFQATNTTISYRLPSLGSGAPNFFRVQVQP